MVINVRVIPRAKVNRIQETEAGLRVHVTKPAEDNRANEAVVEMLAEHFGVRKNQVSIIKGEKSRNKLIEIKV